MNDPPILNAEELGDRHAEFLREMRQAIDHGISPGVRLGDQQHNHVKTISPGRALTMGATFVVVGRPIVAVSDPLAAAARYLQDMQP